MEGALSAYANQAPLSVQSPNFLKPQDLQGVTTPIKTTDILGKLKQLYPQLSQVNPKLLNQLGFAPKAPLQQAVDETPYNPIPTKLIEPEASFKSGGHVHTPEFITGHTGHYASGKGDGQSDDIKALLNDGDYVIDAESVAQLGNGSSKAGKDVLEHFRASIPHSHHASGGKVPAMIADGEYVLPSGFVSALGHGDGDRGAKALDKMRQALREHKRSAPLSKIPPKSKSPLEYLRDGLKMKEKR